ncbi:MAG: hypothetical protein LBN34_00010 [Clostridiales Family XIII bacterium]|nr:hypothetical protein [Clostridiales Family XIII bacterium]
MIDSIKDKNEFDFWEWTAADFITAKPFKLYVNELKARFVGLPLSAIHTMGVLFNNYDNEDLHEWDAEGFLSLDEPIVLDCAGEHIEICFHNTSHAKVGVNTLTMSELSYQRAEWSDVSHLFPNVIGQKIVDIILFTDNEGFYDSVFMGDGSRPDGGDYFSSMVIIFENDSVLELYGQTEYMQVLQRPKSDYRLFPTDARWHLGDSVKGAGISPYFSFVPNNNKVYSEQDALHIYDGDWDIMHWAIRHVFPAYDEHESNFQISIADWERILTAWQLTCEADSFNDAFEFLCGIDYAQRTVRNQDLMYYINNIGYLWNNKDSAWEIYENFRQWFDRVKTTCTHINIYGI